MKVATLSFLHPHKSPGGQQRIAYALFEEAARKYGAANSLFLAADFHAEPLRTAETSRVTEVAPREFVYVCSRYDYQFFTNFDFAGQQEMIRLLESFGPDVVHMHHFLGFGLDFIAFMRARLPGARLVFTVHEFLAICHNNGHLRRGYDGGICEEVHAVRCQQCFPNERLDFFEQRRVYFADALGGFDRISTVSDFAKRTIERNLPLEGLRVIPNGPMLHAEAAPRPAARARKRRTIGFIGQVHAVKGVDLLLDAIQGLAADDALEADSVDVQIFGNTVEPTYREKLDARVAKANEAGLRTAFRGVYAASDLDAVFAELDIVVVPSMWPESYCLTADEAVLARKTLVCADFPAVRERIKEGPGTFFFRSGSMRDLQRALLAALASVEEGAWENPFTLPGTTPRALFEAYERELYAL